MPLPHPESCICSSCLARRDGYLPETDPQPMLCIICLGPAYVHGRRTECVDGREHRLLRYPFRCGECNDFVYKRDVGKGGRCTKTWNGVHALDGLPVTSGTSPLPMPKPGHPYPRAKHGRVRRGHCAGCGHRLGSRDGLYKCLRCLEWDASEGARSAAFNAIKALVEDWHRLLHSELAEVAIEPVRLDDLRTRAKGLRGLLQKLEGFSGDVSVVEANALRDQVEDGVRLCRKLLGTAARPRGFFERVTKDRWGECCGR